VKAQKMAAAANARHPASLLAKQAAALLTSSVKTQKKSKKHKMPPDRRHFL